MKRLKLMTYVLALLLAFPCGLALAGGRDLTVKNTNSLPDFVGSPDTGDYMLIYDASASAWTKADASSAADFTAGGTVGTDVIFDDGVAASPSLTFRDATDEDAVFDKLDAGYLTLTTDATDGLNVLTGNLKVGNGSPDTTLNGEDAYVEGTFEVDGAVRLDGAVTKNMAPSADSGTTNKGVTVALTAPIDTTGTNTHNAIEADLTISNASGGTNTVNGLLIGNVTGDAQVNVNGIKIGTGTTLGTSYGLSIGSGWDLGINDASGISTSGVLTTTGGLVIPSEVVTATNVLAASECGKTSFLNSATEFVSTLPAPTAGCKFKFVVTAAPSGASYTVVTTSSNNILFGHVLSSAGATGDSETSGADTLTFVDGQAVKGDSATCESDGTSWYCQGESKVVAGITIDTAS